MASRLLAAGVVVASGGVAWVGAVGWTVARARGVRPGSGAGAPFPAVVLGCRPGPALDARVAAAAWLWRVGLADRVVVSGAGEAAAGRARALALGVVAAAVVVEGAARDTWENLAFSAALVGRGPWWVVSDRWHLPRALRFAGALGIDARAWPVERAVSARALMREGMAAVYGVGRR